MSGLYTTFIACLGLIGCQSIEERSVAPPQPIFGVDLGNGVEVRARKHPDDFLYHRPQVWINGRKVFEDTVRLNGYLMRDRAEWPWPQARRLEVDEYEVVLELLGTPDVNRLRALCFRQGRLIRDQEVPSPEGPLLDEDHDGFPEYSGVLHLTEAFDSAGTSYCDYTPVLYFEQTSHGLQLDSALTIRKNIDVWGHFYGFDFQFNHPVPCPARLSQ